MKKSKVTLPSFLSEAHKFYEVQVNFLSHIGCDNLENAKRKYDSLNLKVEQLESKLQEVCSITGTSHIGNAFQRMRKTFKNDIETVLIDNYNLDSSFLDSPSPAWVCTIVIEDEDWEQKRDKWHKQRERWREGCFRMYISYLRNVYETCQEEGVDEEDFGRYLKQARDVVEEDYRKLSYKDFWRKYDEDVDISLHIVEQSKTIALDYCLKFIEAFAPRRLFRDLEEYSAVLGEVSKLQYDKWESFYTLANQKPVDEGYPELRRLMFSIVGAMVFRINDKEGWPTPQQENAFITLLSTPEENAAGADWEVSDSTSLQDFVQMYLQLTGAGV